MTKQRKRCQHVNQSDTNEILNLLGGTGSVAAICQIRDGSVSGWRKTGMPKSRYMFLAERYKKLIKTRFDSKPDLFV